MIIKSFFILMMIFVYTHQIPYSPGQLFLGNGQGQVWVVDPNTSTIIQTLTSSPDIMLKGFFDLSGNFYIAKFIQNSVAKFDKNGVLVSNNWNIGGGLVNPYSVKTDNAGNFYVGDKTPFIKNYDASGNFLGTINNSNTDQSQFLDFSPPYTFYHGGYTNGLIKKYNSNLNSDVIFASNSVNSVGDIKILPDGGILVAIFSIVNRWNSSGTFIRSYSPCGSTCYNFGLDLDIDGLSFWTSNINGNQIYQTRLSDGVVLKIITLPSTPYGITTYTGKSTLYLTNLLTPLTCGKTLPVQAKLTNLANVGISGKNVDLSITTLAGSCSATTDSSGVAGCSITLSNYPNQGLYTLTSLFGDESNYFSSTDSDSITINGQNTNLSIISPSLLSEGSVIIQAKLTRTDDSTALPGETIIFSTTSGTVNGITDINGIATATLNIVAGVYTLTANFGSDGCLNSSVSSSQTINVSQSTQFVIWGGNEPLLADIIIGNYYTFWGRLWIRQVINTRTDKQNLELFNGWAQIVDYPNSSWKANISLYRNPVKPITKFIRVIVTDNTYRYGNTITCNIAKFAILEVSDTDLQRYNSRESSNISNIQGKLVQIL